MCEGMPAPFFARGADASLHVPDGAVAVGAGHVVVHRAALVGGAVGEAEAAGPVASGGEKESCPPLWVPWPVGDSAENDAEAPARDAERAAAGSDAAHSRQQAAVHSAYLRAAAWDPRGRGGQEASAPGTGLAPSETEAPPPPAHGSAASGPSSTARVLRCARCDAALGFADASSVVALLKESLRPGDTAEATFRRALDAYGPGSRLATAVAERAAEGQMAFLLLPAAEAGGAASSSAYAAGAGRSWDDALEVVVMASEALVQMALRGDGTWVERHGVRVMWRRAPPDAARRWARERDAQERRVLDEELAEVSHAAQTRTGGKRACAHPRALTQVGALLSRTRDAMAEDARSIGGFDVGCLLG